MVTANDRPGPENAVSGDVGRIMINAPDLEVKTCPACFVRYAMPTEMRVAKQADGTSFFCPNGHSLSFKDNEHDRVRRERDRLKQDTARLEQDLAFQRRQKEAAERRASAAKGIATKLRNRAANGVCPCCSRSFENLHRHMQTKHPDFKTAEIIPLDKSA